jgi:REP element-mobilizing transposase RayT
MSVMNSAKRINEMRNSPIVPLWQRNYFEHVVRDEKELNRIREYIINNPARWDEDEENLDSLP